MATKDPLRSLFDPAKLQRYRSFVKPRPRPSVLGTPAGLKALEEEKRGLASFLGTPDYDARNREANDLAKLQLAMSLMGRGFGAMGAAPQRGESPMAALGRTLVAPLASDVSTIAGPLMKQRAATRLAKEQEERQLKLSALENVRRRQEQEYATEVATDASARQLMIKMGKRDATLTNKYTVDGENIPIVMTKFWDGSFKGFENLDGEKIDKKRVEVWREARTPPKPSISGISDVYVKTIVDGKVVNVPAPEAVRVASPEGTSSVVRAGNQLLDFTPSTGNAVIIKPGSKKSVYQAAKTTQVFATEELAELLGGRVRTNQEITRNTYLPVGDAPEGTKAFSTITVGGATYDLRKMVEKVGDEEVRTYDPEANTVTRKGVTYNLGSLTTAVDPTAVRPTTTILEEVRGQIFGEDGSLSPPMTLTPVRSLIREQVGDETVAVPKTRYYYRNANGIQELAPEGRVSLITSKHQPFKKQDPLTAFETIKRDGLNIGKGEIITVVRAEPKTGFKVDPLVRFIHKGSVINPTKEEIKTFRSKPLDQVERIKAGQVLREFKPTGRHLTVGNANLDALRGVPGLENISTEEKIDLFSIEGDPELGIPTRYQYRYGNTPVDIPPSVVQSGALLRRDLSPQEKVAAGLVIEPRTSFINTGKQAVTVADQVVGPGQVGHFTKTEQNLDRFLQGSFRDAGPVDTSATVYMFTAPRDLNNVKYAPGDDIRLSPTDFNQLPEDVQRALTDDTARRATTLKKNYFKSLWKTITETNRLTSRTPSEAELESLLAMFPAGMRSGGKNLRDVVYDMIKLKGAAYPDITVLPATAAAVTKNETYANSVRDQLAAARPRYEEYVRRGVLPEAPWDSLGFESKRAFANLPKNIQLQNAMALWEKARDRLATAKEKFTPISPDDVGAFSAGIELLILAKYLRDNEAVSSKTGRFLGFLNRIGANTFADVSFLTSGASKQLLQVINRMKASYATLSASEGVGRDAVFRQKIQETLVPAFNKTEAMTKRDLSSLINRLETNLRSAVVDEVGANKIIPKAFEIMLKDVGVKDVYVDQRRYPWIDPNVPQMVPVTRAKVMEDTLGLVPFTTERALELNPGALLPPPPNKGASSDRYVKIRNLDDLGIVVIKQAGPDGRPLAGAPELYMHPDGKVTRNKERTGE